MADAPPLTPDIGAIRAPGRIWRIGFGRCLERRVPGPPDPRAVEYVRADVAAAENERLRAALDAMVIVDATGRPCYRTSNNIPQAMPAKVERVARRALGPASPQK
jgi:hypothetical protein